LFIKPKWKTPRGKPRHKWEDNKIDFMEIDLDGVDEMHQAQGRNASWLL
jgi:hypothetical protein